MRHQLDEYFAEIRANGVASGLMLNQTRSGERRLFEYYNTLRADAAGGPIVRCIAHDVTEQQRAERAVRQAEAEYRTIFEDLVVEYFAPRRTVNSLR